MNGSPDFPILTALVLIPALGAAAVLLVPRSRSELLRGITLIFAAAAVALAIWMLAAFDPHDAGFQFETNRSWVADFGISWHVGVDGISLFLVVLTAVLFPLAMLGATPHHDAKPYYAWLLLLEAGCLGVFVVARSLPVLRDVRDRAGADVLPHRRVGLRQPGLRRARSSSCSPCSGRPSCWSGSCRWPSCNRNAVEDQHLRTEAQAIVDEAQGEPTPEEQDEIAQLRQGQPLSFDLVEIAEGRTWWTTRPAPTRSTGRRPAGSSWPSPSPSR